MTLMPSTAAAVYHDALSAGRRFRTLTFVVLLLLLLLQVSLFLAARFMPEVQDLVAGDGARVVLDDAANAESVAEALAEGDEAVEVDRPAGGVAWEGAAYMAVYASVWLGLVVSILYSLALLFLVIVMLNGRTVGVAPTARAFTRSLLLVLLFVPWQAVLNHPLVVGEPYHVPGVLYQWAELQANAIEFVGRQQWLGWVRFTAWPAIALILLIVTFAGSGRGVKEAFGENLAADDESDHSDAAYEPVA